MRPAQGSEVREKTSGLMLPVSSCGPDDDGLVSIKVSSLSLSLTLYVSNCWILYLSMTKDKFTYFFPSDLLEATDMTCEP